MYKIHPKFLSDNTLRALWRESLTAQQKVAKGASWHSFETTPDPVESIGAYLSFIVSEGLGRGIKLNHELILKPNFKEGFLTVSTTELENERQKLNLPPNLALEAHPIYAQSRPLEFL